MSPLRYPREAALPFYPSAIAHREREPRDQREEVHTVTIKGKIVKAIKNAVKGFPYNRK